MKKLLATLVAFTALFLSGCATYMAISVSNANLKTYHKIFVINNLDDNHQLDALLVQALRQQGKDAESGPNTMIPDDAQAVLTYQDHWLWDFSDHLVGLSLEMKDVHNGMTIGKAMYSGTASIRTTPMDAIQKLITDLFNKKPKVIPVSKEQVELKK